MRRLWLPLLTAILLAACSSAPQKVARGGSPAGENAWRTRPPGFPNFVDHSVGREEISIQAMGLVGIPYRWGGNTPDSGFDCSGLVKYVLARSASVDLPRTTAEMSTRGEMIEPDGIAPGDLVFFNTTGRPHSHVGIYVGKLRFVNAPSTGGTVRLDYLTNPYWAKRFDGIRRMAPPRRTPFDTPTWEASAPAERAPGMGTAPSAAAVASAAPATAAQPSARAVAASQNRIATAPQPVYAAAPPAGPAAPATAPADVFEPPPASLGAAQTQARDAGTLSPAVAPGNNTPAYAAQRDAIDAAADAFEPPPPTATAAARQAVQEGSTRIQTVSPARNANDANGAQIIRAPTGPIQSIDDPIARFANSGY
ncbi:C40 family peptidase [Paraburkholderia lycopersici]|uniref:Cell wall-associated hydrolase, NlpC family n=1 Tax=Paraburkholderia lycopersici TaxID=416944 RepID=A0A1G6L211_9BURK|nr:C40 family peptidase [Paraburkholderia lycopersici]SDC36626.1 Cell wall-associated hydrolase, NlpC family [Paraburkholderia lycopersici]